LNLRAVIFGDFAHEPFDVPGELLQFLRLVHVNLLAVWLLDA
jgi:hypothetical protein